LRFIAYALPTDLGQKTHQEEHELLKQFGFFTDPLVTHCADVDEIMMFYDRLMKKRDALPHQIDGTVIVVNSNKQFERFGVVGKAPRGAIALKFPAEQTTTVVEDIQVQVGRTGALTPVAHLRPVHVAGSLVQRATLHNVDEIKRLGVKIGDTVVIEKAGDIIPDIVEVLPKLRTGKEKAFRMPKKCPVCGAAVKRKDGEVAYYCSNPQCFGKTREQFYHFVSKKAFHIDGLGPKIIDQLLDSGLIATPADLFTLTEKDVEPLERFAETSAKKSIDSIQAARSVELYRLIYALGIRHVGEQTAVMLADTFGSFAKVQHATEKQLDGIHDIGPAVVSSIEEYFQDEKNAAFLEELLQHVNIQNPKKQATSGALKGNSFLFTGTLEQMTRDDAKALVRKNGGTIISTVSKNLDYLVVGDKPGSKVDKAKKLNVKIITEDAFFQMIS